MAHTKVMGKNGTLNVVFNGATGINTVTNVSWESYFHPGDTARVLSQAGAVAFVVVNAVVGQDPPVNKRDCKVLIGVKSATVIDGEVPTDQWIVHNDAWVALPCPPYNKDDNLYLDDDTTDPEIDEALTPSV